MAIKDLDSIIKFRKQLHQNPELSGKEKATANMVKDFMATCQPDETIERIGGHGLAFCFQGEDVGPTTMIRCELDGLPIPEKNEAEHVSQKKGLSHTCGHDGHMAIVAGVGKALAANRPKKGKVVLLFQPAEETGEGAEKVIASRKFKKIKPDFAFALHNLPGFPQHTILLKDGPFAAASKGMIVQLSGKTSHAAHPEDGNSPMVALGKIMIALERLPDAMKKFSLITVVHARLGEVAFGTTPGEATLMATLRAYEDGVMDKLQGYAEKLVRHIAGEYNLQTSISYTESFAATENDPDALQMVKKAAQHLDFNLQEMKVPFRWSEDFGHFSKLAKTTLFGLGAGKGQPQLHEPTYDFPDEIIPTGISLFLETLQENHY